jgi:hypothetical protein
MDEEELKKLLMSINSGNVPVISLSFLEVEQRYGETDERFVERAILSQKGYIDEQLKFSTSWDGGLPFPEEALEQLVNNIIQRYEEDLRSSLENSE